MYIVMRRAYDNLSRVGARFDDVVVCITGSGGLDTPAVCTTTTTNGQCHPAIHRRHPWGGVRSDSRRVRRCVLCRSRQKTLAKLPARTVGFESG